jgi:hypothetical protein
VRDRLKKIKSEPGDPELDRVYDDVYRTNTSPERSDHQRAVQAYRMILGCRRPLRLSELVEALSVKPDGSIDRNVTPAYLLDIMKNFVITMSETGFVQFAHLSVIDYLRGSCTDDFSTDACLKQLAERCLTFLEYPTGVLVQRAGRYMLPRLPSGFRLYVYLNWWLHCQSAENVILQDSNLTISFFRFLAQRDSNYNVNQLPMLSWIPTMETIGPNYLTYRYGLDWDTVVKTSRFCQAKRPH